MNNNIFTPNINKDNSYRYINDADYECKNKIDFEEEENLINGTPSSPQHCIILESSSNESQSLNESISEEILPSKTTSMSETIEKKYNFVSLNKDNSLTRKTNLAAEFSENIFFKNNFETKSECYERILKIINKSQYLLTDLQQTLPVKSHWGPFITVDRKIQFGTGSIVKSSNIVNVLQKKTSFIQKSSRTKSKKINTYATDSDNESSLDEDETLFIHLAKKKKRREILHKPAPLCKKISALIKDESKDNLLLHENNIPVEEELPQLFDLEELVIRRDIPVVNNINKNIKKNDSEQITFISEKKRQSNDLKRPLDPGNSENILKKSKHNSNTNQDFCFSETNNEINGTAPKTYANKRSLLSRRRVRHEPTNNFKKELDEHEDIIEIAQEAKITQPSSTNTKAQKSETDLGFNKSIECPICSDHFPLDKIEIHASECDGITSQETFTIDTDDEAPLFERALRSNRKQ